MPLQQPGYYGTHADGSEARDYCTYCYRDGAFTLPDLTLEGMIQRSVAYMSQNLGFTPGKAEEMSRAVIPQLSRWKK
jgi:hypothetical protein